MSFGQLEVGDYAVLPKGAGTNRPRIMRVIQTAWLHREIVRWEDVISGRRASCCFRTWEAYEKKDAYLFSPPRGIVA